jgi:hypothetical protein
MVVVEMVIVVKRTLEIRLLLQRKITSNATSSSRSNNSTTSDSHTQSEQARLQAETALKRSEENNNRQRDDRSTAQAQPDTRARAQAEAQRKEAEAQRKDATAVFDTVSDSDSVAFSLNTDINSLDYFLAITGGKQTRPGEVAWVKSPANINGYHLYPAIDHNTSYGRLTLEMCAVAQVDYNGSYRTETILFSNQIDQTGLTPNPSDDSEYVPTRHIFAQWIDDIL